MKKSELRTQMTDSVISVLGTEKKGEVIGNVTAYTQEVLFTTPNDDHAQKGSCSYYVTDDDQAFWLRRHQNYVAPVAQKNVVERAKDALDAAIGVGEYKFVGIAGSGDAKVVKVRVKSNQAIMAFGFGEDGKAIQVEAE